MDNVEMLINAVFKYKGNKYLLLNHKGSRFFLRLDDNNKTDYVTLEEYRDINRLLFSFKPIKKFNKMNCKALIKFKNELISLTVASSMLLTMSGCATGADKTAEGLSKIGIEVTCANEENDFYKITKIDLAEEKTYANIDFSSFEDQPVSVTCTPGNFDDYIGNSNVSFDDLRETIKNNKNIPDDVSVILNEGIDNLESANFNMNYSALQYNLSRLKIEELTDETLIEYAAGTFDPITGVMELNTSLKDKTDYKSTVIHEIIGHGSTMAYDKESGVYCNVCVDYLKIEGNGVILGAYEYGFFGIEAIADTITSIALNQKINMDISGYPTQIYDLTTLCSSVGVSIEDYANYGVEYLTEKMSEHGIDNPYEIITSLDDILALYRTNSLLQANSTDLFKDYYKELAENNEDLEALEESTKTYKNYVITEEVNMQPAILSILDDDTYDVIFPNLITSYVNELQEEKVH